MPNGTWKIAGGPPARPGTTGPEYLPEGTRIRLLLQGPSRRAVMEDIGNEIVVLVAVVSPVTINLCRTGLGQDSTFGANICDPDGRPLPSNGAAPTYFEGVAALSRVKGGSDGPLGERFFVRQGARPGAGLMTISIKDKGLIWHLWLKSPDIMVSKTFVRGVTRKDVESFALVWQREP